MGGMDPPARFEHEPGANLREDYLVFGSPQLLDDEIEEVVETLRSAWIGTGPRVARFEEAFASYLRAEHAVAVSSCTAALHLAMVAIGLQPGDEVVVPAMTFASTANAVIHAGGRPVLADVDRETMCLTPDELVRASDESNAGRHSGALRGPAVRHRGDRRRCREPRRRG